MGKQSKLTILATALVALSAAAQSAFDALNEGGRYDGSDMAADPVRYAPQLRAAIKAQMEEMEAKKKYEGLSEEELADLKEKEKAEALARLQTEAAERLNAMNAARQLPETQEPTGEPDGDPGPAGDLDPVL